MAVEKEFLIRDTLKDDGTVPSSETPTYSPDIICYQNNILTYSDAISSYQSYICKSFLQDSINLVYVRAKNNTGMETKGEVKAFYSPLTLLYIPKDWKPLYTEDKEEIVELREAHKEYVGIDSVVLGKKPFVLQRVEDPNLHHCMMALSRIKGEEWLKLPEKFDKGDKDLWEFLRQHSNIAYNNIVIEEGFVRQHSEYVKVGNHNSYEEKYVVRFSLEGSGRYKAGTFGSCNIGKIQMLSTDIDYPFDIRVYPEPDKQEVFSEPFTLPANYDRSIIMTYFAADPNQKVYGTLKHDYISCNSYDHIPVDKKAALCLKGANGASYKVNPEAKLGDFAIIFTDDEASSIQILKLESYETERRI